MSGVERSGARPSGAVGRLPLVVSVPHAGKEVPEYVTDRICLSPVEIEAESDRGARDLLQRHADRVDFIDVDDAGIHRDIDTPDDLT